MNRRTLHKKKKSKVGFGLIKKFSDNYILEEILSGAGYKILVYTLLCVVLSKWI